MLGAIIGDVIGSVYEWHNHKSPAFDLFSRFTRFTDDTVLTVAIADAVMSRQKRRNSILDYYASKRLYASRLRQYARWFPDAGYGQRFEYWAKLNEAKPYKSYGNGSAMRVSPIGFASRTLEEALTESRRSAAVTHNHRHGIRGAQAVAAAVFLGKDGMSKTELKRFIQRRFKYPLERTLDEIRPNYAFDPSCQGSVPQAITAFLESVDFEDAIRKAISIGGDSDTIACITGGIAQAYYKEMPSEMVSEVMIRLDAKFRGVIRAFNEKYDIPV